MTPNVLVISNNCFSKGDSNGRTLGNLFEGWPTNNLFQFYIQNSVPDYHYCKKYFRVTDRQAVSSLFGKQTNGIITSAQTERHSLRSEPIRNRKRNAFSMLVRDFIWSSWKWKTFHFNTWLNEIKPDVVVLQAGDCPFMFYLAVDISKKYNAKLLIYNTEGYYFKEYDYFRAKGLAHVLYPLFHRRLKKSVEKAYNCCDYAVFNCEELRKDYQQFFKIPSRVIYNAASINQYIESKTKNDDRFISIYAGNLGVGRAESLVMVGNALHELNENYKIRVYGRIPNGQVAEQFSNCSGIDYRGFVSYDELISIQQRADLLLHVESFDPFYRKDSKYAFSTKIPDSLAAGKCFLVFAPTEFASSKYLIETCSAHVVTEEKELANTLKRIIEDTEYRNRYLQNAKGLVLKNHQREKNAAAFQNIIQEIGNS